MTRRLVGGRGGCCSTLKKLGTEPSSPLVSDVGLYYHHPILRMLGGNIVRIEIDRERGGGWRGGVVVLAV